MLAKWISREAKATFFDASPSALCRKFYGESEAIIRALFKIAEESSPSVIFMDEVDSLLSRRTDTDQDHCIRMKNQMLQMMDGISTSEESIVVVVAATNRPEILDQAALRRFSKRILVPLPDKTARGDQLRQLCVAGVTNKSCAVSEEELLSISEDLNGWNGSDIKNLCSKAAEYSYEETVTTYGGICNVPSIESFRPIVLSDLQQALHTVNPSCSDAIMASYTEWSQRYGAG
eukprot:GHVQ01004608.1.p1 GENE.GHVQ01004608.1~~GHVQ01004608.1.p1  ORF type:complete len:233 (-),score=34.64 GHVQ01004608.1:443-1141(-)